MKVIVIGAGVFGAWTSLSFAKVGHIVQLLDQSGPGNRLASSAGESRIIRSAYGADEMYTAMAQRALHLWSEFFTAQQQGACFRKTGVLWIAPAEEQSIWQARAIFKRLGIPHEWLNGSAITDRFTQFQIPRTAVALWEPEAGALLAERSVRAVITAAVTSGVHFEKQEVLPPIVGGPSLHSITTADGRRWDADHFVFSCGSWLPKLFPELAGLIRPTRQELFFFAPPGDTGKFAEGVLPVWIDQTDPNLAYGFPDFGGGVKLGFHRLGPRIDPDVLRPAPSDDAIEEARSYLTNRFPAMGAAKIKTTEVCHYENTPNGDFLVDLYPGTRNVWLLGGGSGHGFKHAPAIAEYLLKQLESNATPERRFQHISAV